MPRIISVLLCFVFVISGVYANSLCESYPVNTSGIISFDFSLIKDLLDVNSEHSALTDYFNGVREITKERFGIDLDQDVEQIGCFLFLDNNIVRPIGFICGNFNLNEIRSKITNSIVSEPELLENTTINNENISVLSFNQYKFAAQNDKIIWFCDTYEFKHIKDSSLTFNKAPDYISELSNKSKTFVSFNKELWAKVFGYNPQQITLDLDSVNVVSSYLKNYDIVIQAVSDTQESAEVLKQQLEYFFKIFKDSTAKTKLTIDESYTNIFKQINTLYSLARTVDIIDSLKIEVNDNKLAVVFPYERTNFYNALSDFITTVAIPSYQRAAEENKKKNCYYAQHFLTKVVEKYNNENEPMLYFLDDLSLRTEDYLPYEYDFLKKGCSYSAVGRLDDGGYIVCSEHGQAFPLIKPYVSKERLEQEDEMLKCIINEKIIQDAVHSYNSRINYGERVRPAKTDSKPSQPMTTKLDLELLKEKGFIKKDLYTLSECNYFIDGDITNNGYIGCKKHGLLTNGQLYNQKYDYYFRRPRLIENKREYYREEPRRPRAAYNEEHIFNSRFSNLKKELEVSLLSDIKKDEYLVPCKKNLKRIYNAIEMYNMDNAVMMKTKLDLSALKKIYIRTPLEEISPECEYFIFGDITENGTVGCKKHGLLSDYSN